MPHVCDSSLSSFFCVRPWQLGRHKTQLYCRRTAANRKVDLFRCQFVSRAPVSGLTSLVYVTGTLQVHLPSCLSGHVPTLTLSSIKTFLLGVCIIFSFNWRTLVLTFLDYGILLEDFLDRWMTWWCGVDSRKQTEWPKSLGENLSCEHFWVLKRAQVTQFLTGSQKVVRWSWMFCRLS